MIKPIARRRERSTRPGVPRRSLVLYQGPAVLFFVAAGAALLLDWRTGIGAIGAIDAAVAGLWCQARTAAGAVMKILAGIDRHVFDGFMPAMRAGQLAFKDQPRDAVVFGHIEKSPIVPQLFRSFSQMTDFFSIGYCQHQTPSPLPGVRGALRKT